MLHSFHSRQLAGFLMTGLSVSGLCPWSNFIIHVNKWHGSWFHTCSLTFPCTLASLSLKPEHSRLSLQWSLLREPSLRMLSLSEIFTVKPHVWSKNEKTGVLLEMKKFYHSPFIMTAKRSPGSVGLFWRFSGAHTGIL